MNLTCRGGAYNRYLWIISVLGRRIDARSLVADIEVAKERSRCPDGPGRLQNKTAGETPAVMQTF